MLSTVNPLRRFVTFLYCLLPVAVCFSQPVSVLPASAKVQMPVTGNGNNQRAASTEICGNNIDDDGNGLIDDKDFGCFYNSPAAVGCLPGKIIWACSEAGLYWADPATGTYHFVGNMDKIVMSDIAWSTDGHLYGIDYNSIGLWEIDPYTGHPRSLGSLNGYSPQTALTADREGNLYMVAQAVNRAEQLILKLSPATMQTSVVANLTASNVFSAGDLTFLNGSLYLSCLSSQMARIDPGTGKIQVSPRLGTFALAFGMITMGDGYLYVSNVSDIYRMDPATMTVDASPYYTFPSAINAVFGLSNYAEQCDLSCHSRLSVAIVSPPPYCAASGVSLKATGSGIPGAGVYDWTSPDGIMTTGDALLATTSGMYKVRYHHVPDDCGHDTSFFLDIDCGAHMLRVPNAFSPDANGRNDVFRPVVTGTTLQYEFSVYNRWGQKVFSTTSRYAGWDGKVNGMMQPAGVFAWYCTYRFSGQAVEVQKGTVLLVR